MYMAREGTSLARALLSSTILTVVHHVVPTSSVAASSSQPARRLPSAPAPHDDLYMYHLFIDDTIVQDRGSAAPRFGPVRKSEANPLLREDREWEGSWKNTNPSVVYRDGSYHMWMTANLVCPGASPGNLTDTCAHPGYNYTVPRTAHKDGGLLYARSTDGIHFEKPNLGLVEVFGSTQNNVVYRTGGGPAQTGIFFDEHAQLFRMFGKNFAVEMGQGVGVASSVDGIHNWTNYTPAPSMGLAHGADTRCGTNCLRCCHQGSHGPADLTPVCSVLYSNNALWDESLQRYIAFSRIDSDVPPQYGMRRESRSTAKTWAGPWTHAVQVLEGQRGYEAYALVPFRLSGWRPGLYMGLAAFFSECAAPIT